MLDFLVDNDLLSAIIAFGVVLIPAVIIHELGHFLAARAVGITVLEFGIGFPPRIAKLFTWRETEFTLNVIPLGGFVRPLGEDMVRMVDEETTERQREEARSRLDNAATGGNMMEGASSKKSREEVYLSEREELMARGIYEMTAVNEVKPLPRIVFMSAGAIANFLFAFVLFISIGLIGLPDEVGARLGLTLVDPDSALAEAGFQENDLIEKVDNTYFASSTDLVRVLEDKIGETVTFQMRRLAEDDTVEDVELSFTVTPAIVDSFSSVDLYVMIRSVYENSPAELAGLQPGDLIAYINDVKVFGTADPVSVVQQLTLENVGEEVTLSVLRDGEMIETSLVPRVNPPANEGRMGIGIRDEWATVDGAVAYREGVLLETSPQPPGVALEYGIDRTVGIFRMIAEFPARILRNETEPEERRVVSVVGVSQIGGEILQDSVEEKEPVILMEYIALISIALGFTNLLPIPALDGGRILFVIIEMVRGKPIAPEREGMVHLVGLIFILSVGMIFIVNDLLNPLTDLIP